MFLEVSKKNNPSASHSSTAVETGSDDPAEKHVSSESFDEDSDEAAPFPEKNHIERQVNESVPEIVSSEEHENVTTVGAGSRK